MNRTWLMNVFTIGVGVCLGNWLYNLSYYFIYYLTSRGF